MKTSRSAALLESLLATGMLLVVLTLVLAPLLGPGGLGVGRGPFLGQLLTVQAQLSGSVPGLASLEGGTFEEGEGVELGGQPTVTVTVLDPSLSQRVGLVGSRVLTGLSALGVLALLLAITRSLRRGDVFAPVNARRLTVIALLVALGGTGAQLLRAFGEVQVLDEATVRGSVVPVFELSFLPLFTALAIGVLAEAFRQGAALREDVEGLV